MNEKGFQAVQAGLNKAVASSREGHEITNALLGTCNSQLNQILRNQITFGATRYSVSSPTNRSRPSDLTTMESNVFWKSYSPTLPIGNLRIRLNQIRHSKRSRSSAPKQCTESKIEVTFVPPRWLSNVVMNYSIKLCYDWTSNQLGCGMELEPLTINHNPFFIDAVQSLDVEGMQRSFREGLARPTDYLIDWGQYVCPWYKVGFQLCV